MVPIKLCVSFSLLWLILPYEQPVIPNTCGLIPIQAPEKEGDCLIKMAEPNLCCYGKILNNGKYRGMCMLLADDSAISRENAMRILNSVGTEAELTCASMKMKIGYEIMILLILFFL